VASRICRGARAPAKFSRGKSRAPKVVYPDGRVDEIAPVGVRAGPQRNASTITAEIRATTASQERTAIIRSSREVAGIPRPKLRVVRQALTA
jgi:hypothetical protein